MAALGSLRVELQLDDGSFTTRIIRAGTSLAQLEKQVDGTIVAVRRLDSAFGNIGVGLRNLTITLGLARAAIENVNAAFGSLPASIIRTASEIERLTVLMQGLSNMQDELARKADARRTVGWLIDLAQVAPFNIEALTGAFVRLRAGGIEPTQGAMQALVDAVAAFGGSAEQFNRAAVAIQQMAGKGVISMEELRQQLGESVPNAIPLMARALGVTIDRLVKEISEGRVRAQPALRALFAEMERTFGGRSLQMLNTFRGQVQILETTWTRLQLAAAGEGTGTGDGTTGFLARTTRAIERLNQVLSSPEAFGFAVHVGQIFGRLIDWLSEAVQFAIRFREEIGQIVTALGALMGFAIGRRIFAFFLAEIAAAGTAVTLFMARMAGLNLATMAAASNFTILATAVRTLAVALPTMAMSAFATTVTTVTGGIVGLGAAIGGLVRTLYGVGAAITLALINPIQTARAAWTAFVAFMNAAAAAMAVPFSRLATAMTTTGSMAAGALTVLRGFVSVGLIVGGIYFIVEAVRFLSETYRGLTRDAGAAYERLQQGASDTATILTVRRETEALQKQIETAKRAQRQLDELEQGRRRRLDRDVTSVSGLGIEGLPDVNLLDRRFRSIDQMREALGAYVERAEREIANRQRAVIVAEERQTEQLAATFIRARIAQIQRSLFPIQAEYATAIQRVEDERRRIEQSSELSTDQKTQELIRVNAERLAVMTRQYEQVLTTWQNALRDAEAEFAQAMAGSDEQAKANLRGLVAEITRMVNELRQRREQLGNEGLGAFLGGGKSLEQVEREASTALRNMRARTEELRAEAAGLGGELARVSWLLENSDWTKLPSAFKEQLQEAARALDEAKAKHREFTRAQQALSTIETGLDRATREIESYRLELANPNLTEAQRRFIEFERQMEAALRAVGAAAGFVGSQYAKAADDINTAINHAREGALLSELVQFQREAQQAEIRAAERGVNRLQVQLRQLRERTDNLLRENTLANIRAGRDPNAGAEQILANARKIEEGYRAEAARATASGLQRTENAVTQLRARLAELRAEAAGNGSELAKWTEKVAGMRGISDETRAEILRLAAAIDAESKAVERARNAWNALEDARRRGAEAQIEVEEYLAQLEPEGRFDANRQLMRVRIRAQAALQELLNQRRISAEQAQQLETEMQENLARIAAGYAARQVADMADKERQIREQLAETRDARRQIALDNIRIEEEAAARLLATARVTEEQRARMAAQQASYFAALREQAIRQTEGPWQSFVRQSLDGITQFENAFVSAFEGMAEQLAQFIMTGKAQWEDFARSIIGEITKIAIRWAALQTMKAVFSGFGGGLGGATKAHSGALIGKEGTPVSGMPATLWAAAPRLHTGGWLRDDEVPAILQKGEAVFTPGQLAAIGRMNHSYAFVEQALARMVSAVSAVPASAMPGPMGQAGGQALRGAGPWQGGNVTINLTNQSGMPLEATAAKPRFDADGMIIDVVVRGLSRPGPLRDAVRAISG